MVTPHFYGNQYYPTWLPALFGQLGFERLLVASQNQIHPRRRTVHCPEPLKWDREPQGSSESGGFSHDWASLFLVPLEQADTPTRRDFRSICFKTRLGRTHLGFDWQVANKGLGKEMGISPAYPVTRPRWKRAIPAALFSAFSLQFSWEPCVTRKRKGDGLGKAGPASTSGIMAKALCLEKKSCMWRIWPLQRKEKQSKCRAASIATMLFFQYN